MRKGLAILGSLGVGLALMYLYDPARGKARRAKLKDKTDHLLRVKKEAYGKALRDLKNRAQGVAATAKGWFDPKLSAAETKLVSRVRSKIGRVCTHPSSIVVQAKGDTVALSGPILANETAQVLAAARRAKGVKQVENHLEIVETASGIPALQGEGKLAQMGPTILQEKWSPATAATVGALGALLAGYGLKRRGMIGALCGVAAVGMVGKSVKQLEGRRLGWD